MTRSRSKLPKATGKLGQRRSPRISALEAYGSSDQSENAAPFPSPCMSHLDKIRNNGQGPAAFQTTVANKRKLRPVQELTATASPLSPPNQAVKHSRNHGVLKKSDQPLKTPSSTFVPEKRILELVVDTLQRRDTYEIFAEPVDPNEVEDYYTIIEEPMDFGTMRAKLHEGMYKSLEQFEHDVFLIFNNAMHFNSSGTIYFRQARAINELAKKVFDVLKTNPEKFELEFSETKRKVGRRNPGGFRDSTDTKFSEITVDVYSKSVPCSSRGTLHRKNFQANHGCSDIAKHVDDRDLEVHIVTKDSSRHRSFEDDKRSTYRPLSLSEDESILSTAYGKLKLLERVNQQDVGYRDSLMLFVKDLGPTAQNIAKRKLLGCEIRTASTCAAWRPKTNFNTVTSPTSQYPLKRISDHPNEMRSPKGKMDLQIARGGETAYISDETDRANKVEEGALKNAYREKASSPSPLESNSHGSHRWCDKGFLNQGFCSDLYYSRACVEDLNVSYRGSKETNESESKMENKCKFQSLPKPWPLESSNVSCFVQGKRQIMQHKSSSESVMGDRQSTESECPTRETSCSTSESSKTSTIPLASPSSFVFNLPYLKTRLDQINSSEQHSFSQQDSTGKKGPFFAQLRYQRFFISNPPTDHAQYPLQLQSAEQ